MYSGEESYEFSSKCRLVHLLTGAMTFPQQRKGVKKWAYITFSSLIWWFEWCFDEYSRSCRLGENSFASCVCLLHQGVPIRVGRTRPRWSNSVGNCTLTLSFERWIRKKWLRRVFVLIETENRRILRKNRFFFAILFVNFLSQGFAAKTHFGKALTRLFQINFLSSIQPYSIQDYLFFALLLR